MLWEPVRCQYSYHIMLHGKSWKSKLPGISIYIYICINTSGMWHAPTPPYPNVVMWHASTPRQTAMLVDVTCPNAHLSPTWAHVGAPGSSLSMPDIKTNTYPGTSNMSCILKCVVVYVWGTVCRTLRIWHLQLEWASLQNRIELLWKKACSTAPHLFPQPNFLGNSSKHRILATFSASAPTLAQG